MQVAYVPNISEEIIVNEHNGHTEENEHTNIKLVSSFLEGSPNVYVNNKPVLRKGDIGKEFCECYGAEEESIVLEGNEKVLVNSKPIARVGDLVSHHVGENSKLTLGSSNVLA